MALIPSAGWGPSLRLPSSSILVLVAVIACFLFSVAYGGNCTSIATETIDRAATAFEITGPRITIHPKVGGVVRNDVYLIWDLFMMVERGKIVATSGGSSIFPNYTYVVPLAVDNPLQSDSIDPLEPYNPTITCHGQKQSLPCSPVIQHFLMSDFDCYTEHVVAPFHGFSRESVFVYFTHSSYPNFTFTTEQHVLDGDLIIPLNNSGDAAYQSYSKDSLKLNYVWGNFPWARPEPISFFTNDIGEVHNNGSAMDFWVNYASTSHLLEMCACIYSRGSIDQCLLR